MTIFASQSSRKHTILVWFRGKHVLGGSRIGSLYSRGCDTPMWSIVKPWLFSLMCMYIDRIIIFYLCIIILIAYNYLFDSSFIIIIIIWLIICVNTTREGSSHPFCRLYGSTAQPSQGWKVWLIYKNQKPLKPSLTCWTPLFLNP